MAAQGLFGITAPVDYGGGGLDCLAYAIVMEELSRGYSSVADQCGLVELVSFEDTDADGIPDTVDLHPSDALNAWDLTAIGIGCIIGVGIFVFMESTTTSMTIGQSRASSRL